MENTDIEVARAGTIVIDTGITDIMLSPLVVETASSNPYFLQLSGALVGAEEPNRNNAMWTTADLQYGLPGVKHTPLNWMHRGEVVVGAITDAKMVYPKEKADADTEVGRRNPYIRTSAVMWTWLYPAEAELVQQAAEWGKAFQSMECLSEKVHCVGATGCGEVYTYAAMVEGKTCDHMKERSAVRRFEKPTFLGSGLILPPARPGWANADVQVIKQAAILAEANADQMPPDMTANDWELLMAQVLKGV